LVFFLFDIFSVLVFFLFDIFSVLVFFLFDIFLIWYFFSIYSFFAAINHIIISRLPSYYWCMHRFY